jgi:hypothetical protein
LTRDDGKSQADISVRELGYDSATRFKYKTENFIINWNCLDCIRERATVSPHTKGKQLLPKRNTPSEKQNSRLMTEPEHTINCPFLLRQSGPIAVNDCADVGLLCERLPRQWIAAPKSLLQIQRVTHSYRKIAV